MKNFIRAFFACFLAMMLLMCGCSQPGNSGDSTTEPDGTTDPIDGPAEKPAKHEISIDDVVSILGANELITNTGSKWPGGGSYHGGQQTRVCHTERGTYAVFAKQFGEASFDGIQRFYVAKTDNDNNVSILHYGEFESDDAEITVNLALDTNGDVVVVVTGRRDLEVIVFDSKTDEMTKYSAEANFTGSGSYGYSQPLFDFENRKIYAFYNGGSDGNYQLDWFVFDMETGEWSDSSLCAVMEGVGRHCYLFPVLDGNGGAYFVGVRDVYAEETQYMEEEGNQLLKWDKIKMLFDQLDLFYISDLTSAENIEYTTVHRAYTERGDEGIWSTIVNNEHGGVFVDADGYMHITYIYYIYDAAGDTPDLDSDMQYRHAIYDGMECIYNEEIKFQKEDHYFYKPMIRQSTDGTLHMIVADRDGTIELEFYSAEDKLGKSWKYEKTYVFDESISTNSLSLSGVQEYSVQDNIISGFFYGYYDVNRTVYTFNLSLEDYSVTDTVNLLEGYDLQIDWRYDKRIPYADHQTQVISTANGIYAAFVYNYVYDQHTEYFCIVKIDKDKKSTVIVSDSFESEQNKYLTMAEGPDGLIYVCPPDGRSVYVIDTVTDEITLRELTPIITGKLLPRQTEIVYAPEIGTKYQISVLRDGTMNISSNVIDSEKFTVKIKNAVTYTNNLELIGTYDNIYTLSDGKSGVYMVGTRAVSQEDLEGKLEYSGHIGTVEDSVMLFYIPNLAESTEAQCIDVHLPYEDEGAEGIWSSVKVKDVYLDKNGKLNILYSDCHFDYDDCDRRENPDLIEKTLRYYLAVYDGSELVSREEIVIDELNEDSSVRITETADGTVYLLVCKYLQTSNEIIHFGVYPTEEKASICVYGKTDDGWVLNAEKSLGDFAAEGFFVSDAGDDDVIDCLVYASDRDVYHTSITFAEKTE